MKKTLTLIFLIFSISVMLFGCGTNAEIEKENTSSDKIGETTSELDTEETTELDTEEITEPTIEETPEETTEEENESVIEEPITEEVNTEVQSNFTYDFEGRYWVEYGEYSNGGYYFDGTNVTVAYGEEKNIQPYSVVDGFIMITYEDGCYDELCYYIEGNTLYLAMMEQERCFVEVDKAEFEKLFN